MLLGVEEEDDMIAVDEVCFEFDDVVVIGVWIWRRLRRLG